MSQHQAAQGSSGPEHTLGSPWQEQGTGLSEVEIWGRGSYFVDFCYLRQRDRLTEDVACVFLLQLLKRLAEEDEEGGQLHFQCHLLHFDLKQRTERG